MTLPVLPDAEIRVTLGVDTHAEVHVAVALDQLGRRLGVRSVPATPAGSAQLLAWASHLGPVEAAGSRGPAAGAWGWPAPCAPRAWR